MMIKIEKSQRSETTHKVTIFEPLANEGMAEVSFYTNHAIQLVIADDVNRLDISSNSYIYATGT